ncbi:MAG: transposase [Nocardioides sp.]|nr:transposase [Nocardioides sp.]
MPKAFPKEFREDVVRVFKESDSTIAQVAKDFGVSTSCLQRWLAQDEEASAIGSSGNGRPGGSPAESAELREARKRIRLLEQENEVLRKAAAYFAQANLPGK